MKLSKRTKKIMIAAVSVIVLAFLCSLTAFADGEVAGAVESTWNAAKGQIKTGVFMEYCGTLRFGCKYAVYSIHRGGKAACEQRGLDRISPHEGREIRESWARIQADLL